MSTPYEVKVKATELIIQNEECPWCGAMPGEECNFQERKHFELSVHLGRMPTNISPEDYIKKCEEANR